MIDLGFIKKNHKSQIFHLSYNKSMKNECLKHFFIIHFIGSYADLIAYEPYVMGEMVWVFCL